VQLVNVSTETDAKPVGKSVWVAEMYGYALGAARLGLRHRGVNDTNHHPPGDPVLRAHLLCVYSRVCGSRVRRLHIAVMHSCTLGAAQLGLRPSMSSTIPCTTCLSISFCVRTCSVCILGLECTLSRVSWGHCLTCGQRRCMAMRWGTLLCLCPCSSTWPTMYRLAKPICAGLW